MIQYITTLSKYFITIFITLYTMECFLVFRHKDEKSRRGTYTRQVILIVLIHFTCFLSICLKTGDINTLFFYAIFQVIILTIIEVYPMIFPRINRLLINNACMLISIGLITLVRLNFQAAIKQLIITVISFLLAGLIPFFMKKIKRIPNWNYAYAFLGLFMLLAVFILGNLINGSKLAITIFGISFQASEFVKILFVIFIAGSLYKDTSFKTLAITTVLAALHVFVLAMSRDLGAALILFVVYVLLIFIATRNYFYLILGSFAGCGASIIAYKLFRHIQVRVKAFIDPFSVIDNEGYQITQSLFAIGSGSWAGLGLYNGTPETIPYVETDFIFSAISQEFGLIFSICLILICLSCFIMFINISFKFHDNFYRLICIGLGITYIFQVFLTVGGGTKFIPLTGVTLPLVSYGGSSIMATIFTFFIIEGMYVVRGKEASSAPDRITEHYLKRQNRITLAITYLFIALFIALSTYLCIYCATHEEELINNAYNPRQEVLITQNVRGKIYSRDLEVLAETINDKEGERRFYPFYNIFSHVVGYDSNGKSGIEGQANYYLINTNQPLSERMAADLNGDKYLADSVKTTLDVGLQKVAYTAIGSYNGAVIVSNPKTGEIYAMVSKPDYDPNEIKEIWDDLLNDSSSSVLLNRVTQGLYPPGSTFKIISLLEYIKENPDTYNQYSFNCTGELKVDNGKIICYNHDVHGAVGLKRSLAISCNSSFGNIGLKLDRSMFQNTLDELLFNSDLPLAMNYSESKATISDDMDELSVVRTAFGQGETLMTPMHLNMITNAIANDGVLMKPYLISEVMNSNFITVKSFDQSEYKSLMTKEEADIITTMMNSVIESGTGKKLKNKTYTVAGKTGSAEYSDFSTSTHSWFTGFAPVDDPEISVTIILEDAGTSGLHAVPMAKKIFDEYFRRLDDSQYVEEN